MPTRPARRKKKRPLKVRRRRARIFLSLALLAAALLAVAFGIFGLRRPEVLIQNVSVSGASLAREELVRVAVEDMLDGSYALIIPKRNVFLFPRSALEKKLVETFHPIRSVVVERSAFTGIALYITERTPDALWCRENASVAEECFLMDSDGFIFSLAPASETASPLLRFGGGNPTKPLGERYLPDAYRTLRGFVGTMANVAKRTPFRITVDEHDDVSVSFEEGGEIRFAKRDMGDMLLQNIASVFSAKKFSDNGEFEYVDFRFGNKVYVKRRE